MLAKLKDSAKSERARRGRLFDRCPGNKRSDFRCHLGPNEKSIRGDPHPRGRRSLAKFRRLRADMAVKRAPSDIRTEVPQINVSYKRLHARQKKSWPEKVSEPAPRHQCSHIDLVSVVAMMIPMVAVVAVSPAVVGVPVVITVVPIRSVVPDTGIAVSIRIMAIPIARITTPIPTDTCASDRCAGMKANPPAINAINRSLFIAVFPSLFVALRGQSPFKDSLNAQ